MTGLRSFAWLAGVGKVAHSVRAALPGRPCRHSRVAAHQAVCQPGNAARRNSLRQGPVLLLALLLGLASLGVAGAQTASSSARKAKAPSAQSGSSEQFVDGIAAIVDKQVITMGQLAIKTRQMQQQMRQQGIPIPDAPTMRHQVLQQMINQVLQEHEAERIGIRVSDVQVDHAVQSIAQRNRISVERLRKEVESDGMSWQDYREELRSQIRDDILRQRFVEDRIFISDSDIDAFLSMHEGQPLPISTPPPPPEEPEQPEEPEMEPVGPELIELAQILIEVPDYASNDTVSEKRQQAEQILRKLKSGADFAGLAASSSDGPQALEGGNMGIRPLADWPDLFVQAIRRSPPGAISEIIHSGRGFHILKVLRRGYASQRPVSRPKPRPKPAPQPQQTHVPDGPIMVTQTHARHILIKTSQVMSDERAQETLQNLRQRIEHGESFAELAQRHSEDASAPKGGDLGWLSPGETVPAFEQAMDATPEGQVSQPVHSPFGWHLIMVEGRRTQDMQDEVRRLQARRELMQRRIGPAYEDWLDQLRSQAYIDIRIDREQSRP